MKYPRRVVVTGFGLVSPLGNTIDELTSNVFAGKSGIKQFEGPYLDKLNCKVAAQADFDPAQYFEKKSDYSILDRVGQMALHATKEAVNHADIDMDKVAKDRTGVYVGTGMGGIHSVEDGYQTLFVEGENRLKPYTVLMCITDCP